MVKRPATTLYRRGQMMQQLGAARAEVEQAGIRLAAVVHVVRGLNAPDAKALDGILNAAWELLKIQWMDVRPLDNPPHPEPLETIQPDADTDLFA